MKRAPKLTIGLPIYNGEAFLARALDSFLGQEFSDFELIISDNASEDRTPEICREYERRDSRVRCYRNNRNRGAVFNYNRALELAQGEYFKWTGHDDWCDPGFLGRCIAMLDDDPAAVLCFTDMAVVDESEEPFRYKTYEPADAGSPRVSERFHWVMWSLNDCTGPVFGVMRTESVRKTRGIPNVTEPDRIFLAELSLYGSFIHIPEALFFHYGPAGHTHRDSWRWLDPGNVHRPRIAALRIPYHYLSMVWRARVGLRQRLGMTLDVLHNCFYGRPKEKVASVVRRRKRAVE